MEREARVLVTGAGGFIGRTLCETLSLEHFQVIPVSRRSISDEVAYVGEINGVTDWTKVLPGVHTVFHLAAHVHVTGRKSPLDMYREVNVEGTRNLALQAADCGVRRIVFLSSIKVNGEFSVHPLSERDTPHPADAYGLSKLEAEQVLGKISEATGLEVVIIRPPLVYGPGVKANFLNLMRLVESGVPLPFGGFNNKRSLIYVGNLVNALILCGTDSRAAGNVYLISDGPAISTPDLIKKLAAAMGSPSRVFSVPSGIMYIYSGLIRKSSKVQKLLTSMEIDDSKVRSQLGWIPPYSLEQGLEVTAGWFKNRNLRPA